MCANVLGACARFACLIHFSRSDSGGKYKKKAKWRNCPVLVLVCSAVAALADKRPESPGHADKLGSFDIAPISYLASVAKEVFFLIVVKI
jgi:hypothetical protein